MKMYLKHWAGMALLATLAALTGCSTRGGGEAYDKASAAEAGEAQLSSPLQSKTAGRLLIWSADFSLEVADVAKASQQLSERIIGLGGYVEETSEDGSNSQSFVFRVPKDRFETALSSVEQSGTVLGRHVKGEDVTEQYVDVETRLNNNRGLRDRLKALLDKAKDVKDIIQIEGELNRIQSEIDSMEARLRILKDQIQMSTINVSLSQTEPPRPATIYGPLGYLYKGAEWFVTKLFIIRE